MHGGSNTHQGSKITTSIYATKEDKTDIHTQVQQISIHMVGFKNLSILNFLPKMSWDLKVHEGGEIKAN